MGFILQRRSNNTAQGSTVNRIPSPDPPFPTSHVPRSVLSLSNFSCCRQKKAQLRDHCHETFVKIKIMFNFLKKYFSSPVFFSIYSFNSPSKYIENVFVWLIYEIASLQKLKKMFKHKFFPE